MASVDDMQNQEERLAQLAEEKKKAEALALKTELEQEPLKDPKNYTRTRTEVPLMQIHTGVNLRTALSQIQELALSIRQRGLLQPLVVTPRAEGDYLLVAGHRRLAALQRLDETGEMKVPVEIIETLTEAEVYELMLLENAQRVELSPLQTARALRLILDMNPKLSLAEVSNSLGLRPAWVKDKFKLLELPDSVQEMIEEGNLNFTIAKVLERGQRSGHIDKEKVKELAKEAAEGTKSAKDIKSEALPTPPPKTIKIDEIEEKPTDNYRPSNDDFWRWQEVKSSDVFAKPAPEIDAQGKPKHTAATAMPNRQIKEGDFEEAELLAAEPARGMENERIIPLPEDLNEQLDIYLLGWLLAEHGDQNVFDELQISQGEAYTFAAAVEDEERTLLTRRLAYQLLTQSGNTLQELVNPPLEDTKPTKPAEVVDEIDYDADLEF